MLTITNENFHDEVEAHEGLVVLDLYAEWCAPCRMMTPVIEALEQAFPNVKFGKICVDEQPQLAAAFHVESIPMIALVKNNVFVDLSVGFLPKEDLQKLIEAYQ